MFHRLPCTILLLVAPAVVNSTASEGQAALRGKTLGGVFFNNVDEIAQSCMRFNSNGTMDWDQDFGQGKELFHGTYVELNLFVITFWQATLRDRTPDGVFTMTGVGFADTFSFMSLTNADIDISAIGIYSTFNNCVPGASAASGPPSSGIGGGRR